MTKEKIDPKLLSTNTESMARIAHMVPRQYINTIPSNWEIKPNPEDEDGLTIIARCNIDNQVFIGTPKDFSAFLRGDE